MGSDIDELNPGEARNQSTAPLPRQLCDELRYRLAQVVNGYTGRCDEDAARAGDRVDARAISGSRADAAVLMDELTKAFPNVWCPNCNKVQPMEFATMKANDRNDHDAADILCGECKFVVATLHAEPATQFA